MIIRPSIVVAVAGKREQAMRFDPFSSGAHYHIRPWSAPQIPIPVAEGQQPLDAILAFFESCGAALGRRVEERRQQIRAISTAAKTSA